MPNKFNYSRFTRRDKSDALFVNYETERKTSVCLFSTMPISPNVDFEFRKRMAIMLHYFITKTRLVLTVSIK